MGAGIRKWKLSVALALGALPNIATASESWETSYPSYRQSPLEVRRGHLFGFLSGHLDHAYYGDERATREHYKRCLAFARFDVLEQEMDSTNRSDGRSNGKLSDVILRTLVRMCGPYVAVSPK